jgi:2-keto-4-pentenoate hydratase
MIEPELAFVLGEDLKGPGVNRAAVISATVGIMPAFELVDMRFGNAQFSGADAVSVNAFSSGLVLGGPMRSPVGLDLRTLGLVLEVNGEVVDTAAGASVLDDPALPVAWLANKLAQFDKYLSKGHIIISGSFTAPYPAKKGQYARALFNGVGEVSVKFS